VNTNNIRVNGLNNDELMGKLLISAKAIEIRKKYKLTESSIVKILQVLTKQLIEKSSRD
jgi:Mor family transcriptional regulator